MQSKGKSAVKNKQWSQYITYARCLNELGHHGVCVTRMTCMHAIPEISSSSISDCRLLRCSQVGGVYFFRVTYCRPMVFLALLTRFLDRVLKPEVKKPFIDISNSSDYRASSSFFLAYVQNIFLSMANN